MINALSRSQLADKMDKFEKMTIVDLGLPVEYERVHLLRSVNIPLTKLAHRAPQVIPGKGSQVVLYNAPSEQHLWEAAQELAKLGYHNIFVFPGGLKAWQDGSLNTETNIFPYPGQLNPYYQFTTEPEADAHESLPTEKAA